MSEVQKCRECGGENLFWSQCNSNKTGIAEGRLRTAGEADMIWYFLLGWLVLSLLTASVLTWLIRRDKLGSGEE